MGFRERLGSGPYELFSLVSNPCMCLSAPIFPPPMLLFVGSKLEARGKAGLQCPSPISL